MTRRGIKRTKYKNDGTKKTWFRYPVITLWNGEYCPYCLNENVLPECHHIVPVSDTLIDIGKEQNYHRNLIYICYLCHGKITYGGTEDVDLIYNRQMFYLLALYGFRSWKFRSLFEKAVKSYDPSFRDRFTPFLEYIRYEDSKYKYMGKALYRDSFMRPGLYKTRDLPVLPDEYVYELNLPHESEEINRIFPHLKWERNYALLKSNTGLEKI